MTSLINYLRCLLGFHDWELTAFQKYYGLEREVECKRCKKRMWFSIYELRKMGLMKEPEEREL